MKKLVEVYKNEQNRSILFIIISGISILISFLDITNFKIDIAWLAIILCGVPIIKGAVEGLIQDFDIKADVLVALALVAAILIGEIFAASEVAFIMTLGALLEERTVAKARAGIEKLVHLTPRTARVLRNGVESIISAEQVKVGDLLRVIPGETIAVDGIIITGETSVNQSIMTGESLPVDKGAGEDVFSGTVNQFGTFDMEATKVGEDSSLQRMIKLVESADTSKAKIVRMADRWATWIVVIALISAIGTWFVTGEIIRAVTVLIVFCPCALVLATPTAIIAGIGNATKYGILVREGDALERLAKVTKIAFDKTGTLTYGKPCVVAVQSINSDISSQHLLKMTASAELRSEHPLGKAIVSHFRTDTNDILEDPQEFVMFAGRGVQAQIGDEVIVAGNKEFLIENSVIVTESMFNEASTYTNGGCTIIYVAINGKQAGFIALSDTLRKDSKDIIKKLQDIDVECILLSGDNSQSVSHIAKIVGIANIHSKCLPEDKMSVIELYQKKNEMVCMVGDGVNDAPSLKKAYVGIAMGGIGSDIAVEAADIALINDDIKSIAFLISLSRRTMVTIKWNLALSMLLNFAAIILAMTGILSPILGALVHNVGSVAVIINSALLLNYKNK
ncbi:heavy metal translocating P-type ATPase [Alkalibaculum sp. M08DMB]|uniref:Cd(2+)-exporting ATPase n=1 Tax=Alkalibaculum sporogenes TaxID=2655001 RepID=A0A6A7KBY2_9FIRM|nr:cation-translocating P-type ATPase [Alkalibaculum sporogenes]MPW26791.1 heavy metal translocating P-type ATPase [Alkalibaculum sporogenes]